MSTETRGGAGGEVASDAAQIAGGSGILFAGSLIDRGLRLVVTWLLSNTLGAALFGLYTFIVTIISVIAAFTPLGLDTGTVMFGARYLRDDDRQRLKGMLLFGAGLVLISGITGAALLSASTLFPDLWGAQAEAAPAMRWAALAVVIYTPLLFSVGVLRSTKDMRGNAIAFQIILPATLLLGVTCSWLLGLGLTGALVAFIVSLSAGMAAAGWFVWRRFGALIRDPQIKGVAEIRTWLSWSIPQSLAAVMFRLNMWMDILMLGWMASSAETGLYKVAASLAMLGALPVNAVGTMFNPFIAELVHTRELLRLNSLLKIVTRWLIIFSLPFYIVLLLVPDVALAVFKPEYQSSRAPLLILVLGQAVVVACAPTMRLIPMSGHSMLNFINGAVAALLNIGLNYLWIPQHGAAGAAMASAVTMAAWSLWRVVEVWLLLRCFPFSARSLGLLAVATITTAGAVLLTEDAGAAPRLLAAAVDLLIFAAAVALFGRSSEDEFVVSRIKKKLLRPLARLRRR